MLTVLNLYKSYLSGNTKYPVLKDISLEIAPGEFTAVMGPSGSGKTTLLNCISCYLPADSGSILLNGTNLARLNETEISKIRNEKLGFIFQDFLLLDGLTVLENIMVPRIIGEHVDSSMEKRAAKLCEIFGISHIKNKYPADISGGEKQRTAVARALMNNPEIILADEPTGNLDSRSSRAVIDSFLQAKKELNATIFMVTHDSFAASFCDKVIILEDGCVRHTLVRGNAKRLAFQDRLLAFIRLPFVFCPADYRLLPDDVFPYGAKYPSSGRRFTQTGDDDFCSRRHRLCCVYPLCRRPFFPF